MPAVLTTGDSLKCISGGTVQATGADKVVAGGHAVLTKSGVESKSIIGCGAANPPPLCTSVKTIAGGVATKLLVGGSPVLLAGLAATPDQPHPIAVPTAGQSKLVAA